MKNQFFLLLNYILVGTLIIILSSCGIYKKTDSRQVPQNALERARKNIEEGKGVSIQNTLGKIGKNSTNYEFSTSNPLWRATLETLDFLPLTTVDYSGGIVITDWYQEKNNSNDFIKITIRFLSNEIRSDSLKIIVHNKKCNLKNECNIITLNSKIKTELASVILSKASILEKNLKKQ